MKNDWIAYKAIAGKAMRRLRESYGMDPEEFTRLTGIPSASHYQYERGEFFPGFKALAMMRMGGLDLNQFFDIFLDEIKRSK